MLDLILWSYFKINWYNSSLTKNVNTLNFVNIKIEAAKDEVTALINKLHDLVKTKNFP